MGAEEHRHPEADGPSGSIPLAELLTTADRERKVIEFPGAELLCADAPREVLRRLASGDPLELSKRAAQRQRERAILAASERLLACTLARVAHAAMGYRGAPPLDEWLRMQIDLALEDIRTDDREGAIATVLPAEPKHFEFVARAWGVDTRIARDSCAAFNALPDLVRAAYWALAIERKSLNRAVAEGLGPPALVEARVKRALITLGTLRDPGGSDDHGGDFRVR